MDLKNIDRDLQELMNTGGTTGKPPIRGSFPRADLEPEMFDTLVLHKGYRVRWEEAMFCSCYNMDSGQPSFNCEVCKGKGYVYLPPKETRVAISSISGHKGQERIGLHEAGTAYATTLSFDHVGFRDRMMFIDFTMKYSEVMTDEFLRYEVMDMIEVRNTNARYIEGIDFHLSLDRMKLEWVVPRPEQYSVLYTTYPVYIVMHPIHELRGTYTIKGGLGQELFKPLPRQFQIKREDFVDSSVYSIE